MAAYSDVRAPHHAERKLNTGKLVNIVGACVSLAVVASVGVWGYKLVMRDVTGVPVVRAMEGAMRQAPSNPGGEIAPNLGLSVNDVAALGGATAPEDAEAVLLAPQTAALPAEDLAVMPTAEAGEVMAEGVAAALEKAAEPEPEAVVAEVADPAAPMTAEDILKMADNIAAGVDPLTNVEAADVPPVQTSINGVSTDFIADIIPASVPGVSESPRPTVRPANLVVAKATTTVAVPAATPVASGRTVDQALAASEALAIGTNLVQIGAYDSAEVAQTEWARFNAQFPDYMSGKTHVIQRAERGGRVFYRLRAVNFDDLSDTRRFCAALLAEGVDCVPVVLQ